MQLKARVKRNSYFDSITLMKIARSLTGMPGINDAAVIMATKPNLQLLAEARLAPPEIKASPSDILMVVQAVDDASADAALAAAEEQFTHRQTNGDDGVTNPQKQYRSLEHAAQQHPHAQLTVISIPGSYASLEAERSLRAGLDVFLFSDNVPLEDEIALKRLAQEQGRMLMGPDCGTAMRNGVGLGFVNVVPRGSIGIVGASGTGIQQVMSLIAQEKCGISQVIGCGGRDLSEAVGAVTTLQGLNLLHDDPETEIIVLISKPPAPSIAKRVLEVATASEKPVVVMFVGADTVQLQATYGNRLIIARTLTEAAQQAVSLSTTGSPLPSKQERIIVGEQTREALRPSILAGGVLAGLFSGGTLCDEAMHIWSRELGPIYSNIPLQPEWRLSSEQQMQVNHAIDFGSDEYTRGRPHPMIDPDLRLKHFQKEANDPQVRVILLDMVLGYCSHPDPASVYGPAILDALEQATHTGRSFTIVISLCGTEEDPQRLSVQAAKFRDAGAEVFTSNADAALHCIEVLL